MKILWIPHDTWKNPQRSKIFCQKLSGKHEVHITDWEADFNKFSDYFSLRYYNNFFYREYSDQSIHIHHIPRFSPALFSKRIRDFNSKLFIKYVQKIIDENDIDVVIGSFVCPPPRAKKLIFDVFDDNPGYWDKLNKTYANEIKLIEDKYLEVSDKIVVVSSVLAEKINQSNVHLIPNGVDLKRFQIKGKNDLKEELGIKGSIIGFIGHQDRKDELLNVLKAAKILQHRDIYFIIVGVGAAFDTGKKYIQYENLTNVKLTGYVDSEKLPYYYDILDVGLCPYVKTSDREAGSSIKLLEYTAAGKPVVATNLEQMRRIKFSNVILVEDNPESLAEGIETALNNTVQIPDDIKNYDINHLVNEYEKILEC